MNNIFRALLSSMKLAFSVLIYLVTLLPSPTQAGNAHGAGAQSDKKNLTASEIDLMVGAQKSLTIKSQTAIDLTGSQYLVLKREASKLTLIGKKPGMAFLTTRQAEYRIVIYPSKFESAYKRVENILENSLGLTLTMTPQKIVVKGIVESLNTWQRLAAVKNNYSSIIEWELRPSSQTLRALKEAISNDMESRSLFSASFDERGGQPRILALSQDPKERKKVDELAKSWGIEEVTESSRVELKPMIEVNITIAEVKKSKIQNLGLALPQSYSATIIPSSDLGTFSNQFNPLNVQLNTQMESHAGKVLANPRIICRSGEAAHFVAGGEIPIKMISWKNSDVVWKRYGVILDITPLADIQNAISTKLVTEVSLIDEAHKVDGIPGFLTNRIETHFDIRGEKTIALSGLIKNEIGRGSQDTPLLSSIPLLGELFKSKDYKENNSELVVFVTPKVISPENFGGHEIKKFWADD